ncbi:hypothetical protein LTR37_012871 [Vermiconidia calcicola]|uniref:Uncharacterized protein n=1 Tax=Vermiconidia calcicola TaxID=1690605 RepID=A0ACC3MY13_9PEZI|nr:hypothetical protein LTR37_012871 [Vermiconidia calcicola]
MPHATNEVANMTNGEKPSSKFISHLTQYPVVSDSVETFKSNPYGKKSIELADSAYQRFGKPVEPYLETPYNYAKPYVAKADEIADDRLSRIESRFPIVKEETNTVVDKGKDLAFWPITLAGDGKNYLVGTWQDEYNKTASHKSRGPGFQTLIMALISTELRVASDFFQLIADFLGPKYEESKKKGSDYVKQAQDTAGQYKDAGKDKLQQYQKVGEEKTDQAKKEAQKTKDDAQNKAYQTKDDAQNKAQETKEEAQKKTQK